jgi:hypothetical protein
MAKHFRSLEAPWKRIGGWKWKTCATKTLDCFRRLLLAIMSEEALYF